MAYSYNASAVFDMIPIMHLCYLHTVAYSYNASAVFDMIPIMHLCYLSTVAYSYNASAVFEVISGATVGSPIFDLNAEYVSYLKALKNSVSC